MPIGCDQQAITTALEMGVGLETAEKVKEESKVLPRHLHQCEMRKQLNYRSSSRCLSFDSESESSPICDCSEDSDDSLDTGNFDNPNHRFRWETGEYVGSDFLGALKKCADNGEVEIRWEVIHYEGAKNDSRILTRFHQGFRDMPDKII